MDYYRLSIILKRYDFLEKMRVLQFYSRLFLEPTGVKLNIDKPLPWELETFFLFSVMSYEYQHKNFIGKNINDFVKIINCIKNFQHPKLTEQIGNIKFADLVIISHGSTQFDIQAYSIYKYYRYNYFFNYVDCNINMKEEFLKKFNVSYDCFLKLGFSLSFFCSLKINLDPEILRHIVLKYADATAKLILSRDKFCKKIEEFSNSVDDYLYCVRPSYIYPFIEYNGIAHFPLPHCMTRAITDSLLYRLTDGNSNLRSKFGKHVLERYVFDIIYESNLYSEVIEEREYKNGKNLMLTPDVMVRNNDEYIFFECKSTVPYAKTRVFEDYYIESEVNRIADNVIQLFKQLRFEFNNSYNFFAEKQDKIELNNIFGVIVLLEESYIRRNLIYDEVFKRLSLTENDGNYYWILNNIKVCNLHDIEEHVFTSNDLIYSIKNQRSPYDFLNKYGKSNVLTNSNVINFKSYVINEASILRDELVDCGLIQ